MGTDTDYVTLAEPEPYHPRTLDDYVDARIERDPAFRQRIDEATRRADVTDKREAKHEVLPHQRAMEIAELGMMLGEANIRVRCLERDVLYGRNAHDLMAKQRDIAQCERDTARRERDTASQKLNEALTRERKLTVELKEYRELLEECRAGRIKVTTAFTEARNAVAKLTRDNEHLAREALAKKALRAKPRVWDAEHDAVLATSLAEGMNYTDIAAKVGRTRSAVISRAKRLRRKGDAR